MSSSPAATPGPLAAARPASPSPASDRAGLFGGLALGGVMLLIAVSIALSGGRATPTDQVAAGGTTSGTTTGTADGTRVITVRLADLRISPAVVEIAAGTRVFLDVTNADAMAHDLHIDGGPATPMLKPGATARLDLGAMRRTVAGWCTVPGHKAAGMVITIKVTGASHAAVNTSEAS